MQYGLNTRSTKTLAKTKSRNTLRQRSRTITYLLLAILVSACGGGGSPSSPGTGTGTGTTGVSENEGVEGNTEQVTLSDEDILTFGNRPNSTVQDIWLYQSISLIKQDGVQVDITSSILESLQDDLAEPFQLYGDVTFSATTKLQPQILTANAQTRDHIHVMAGILSDGETSALAVIATPDTSAGTLVERDDILRLDFSTLPIRGEPGDVILSDHYFAVALIEAAQSDFNRDDRSAIEKNLSKTAAAIDAGYGLVMAAKKGQDASLDIIIAKLTVGAIAEEWKADLPAKSHAMIDGVASGVAGCIPTINILCAGKLFNSLGRGMIKSGGAIFGNFPPINEPPTNGPPGPFDPPGIPGTPGTPGGNSKPRLCIGKCATVLNDPHIKTFDGKDYSPQPVGEMTAIKQMPNSGIPFEMQLRFGPIHESKKVSVVTAVAFQFGDTRITFDYKRDVLIAVNGEPVELNHYPEKQLTSTALNLVMAERGNVIELDYEDWFFSIRASSSHLNVAAGAMKETADVVGLFGNLDGNPDNDLTSRDGTVTLTPESTIDDLYKLFLNSWRVTDESSLFDYGPGESTATFTDLSYPSFPEGVASKVTLADNFHNTIGLDTRRAEGACRRAGITEEPLFSNCVADYVLSGNTEFIAGQQQALEISRRDRVNRFGAGINGKDMVWWQLFEGRVGVSYTAPIVSNGRILLVRSFETDESQVFSTIKSQVVDAIDGLTGRKLWRLKDTLNICTPTFFDDNLIVLQADGETELGGENGTNDLLLIDAQTGDIIDRWQPTVGSIRNCSVPLQVSSDNTLVVVDGSTQYGLSIIENQFAMLWEYRFQSNDPEFANSFKLEPDALVKGNNLFRIGHNSAADVDNTYTVYQIDTTTGVIVDRLNTSITDFYQFHDAGPSHIAIAQEYNDVDIANKLLLVKTPAANTNESMQVAWEREGVGREGPRPILIGLTSAYSDDSSFALLAADRNTFGNVIAEFDSSTGDVNALLEIKGTQWNSVIVKLRNGAYIYSPAKISTEDSEAKNSMLIAVSDDASKTWNIDRVEGIEISQTLHLLDDERLVMVAQLTDLEGDDPGSNDWIVFAVGTKR